MERPKDMEKMPAALYVVYHVLKDSGGGIQYIFVTAHGAIRVP